LQVPTWAHADAGKPAAIDEQIEKNREVWMRHVAAAASKSK
jgi:hypothetical protein